MKRDIRYCIAAILLSSFLAPLTASAAEEDGKLRIVVFGAHPDDAQHKAGGTTAKWAKLGHHVKLVSVTYGDIGHWQMTGAPLAQRRFAEVKKADAIIGAADGYLVSSHNRSEYAVESAKRRSWQQTVDVSRHSESVL